MSTDNNKPNFFAVVPAPVLFHDKISDFSVRLFAVISTLCQAEGYCNAKNKTLGDWVGASTSKVSRAITELAKYDLVTVEIKKNASGTFRKIYLCISRTQGLSNSTEGGKANMPNGLSKNDKGGGANLPIQKNSTSINSIKTNKGVVSVPKTKAQAFAETIEQAEFPTSFPEALNGYLKRYFANLHEVDPQKFSRAADIKKIIKQVYGIREAGHSDEYLVKLIALCNEKNWKSVSIDYLKDDTANAKSFNDGGVMRPNSIKIP